MLIMEDENDDKPESEVDFNLSQLAKEQLPLVLASMIKETKKGGIAGIKAAQGLLELSGYSALDGQKGQVYEVQIIPIAWIDERVTACPHLQPVVIYKAQSSVSTPPPNK